MLIYLVIGNQYPAFELPESAEELSIPLRIIRKICFKTD